MGLIQSDLFANAVGNLMVDAFFITDPRRF